jgi:hypothetical protein
MRLGMDAKSRLGLTLQLGPVVLAIFFAVMPARADTPTPSYRVSRFGNFEYYFINDVAASGETYMDILRIYNSYDNEETGIFGTGWGSFFEENLQVQDDGSIVIHEYGGGANNIFTPTTTSLLSQKKLREQIMQAAGEVGQFGSDADRRAYQNMLADSDAEQTTWTHLSEAGLLKLQEPAVG